MIMHLVSRVEIITVWLVDLVNKRAGFWMFWNICVLAEVLRAVYLLQLITFPLWVDRSRKCFVAFYNWNVLQRLRELLCIMLSGHTASVLYTSSFTDDLCYWIMFLCWILCPHECEAVEKNWNCYKVCIWLWYNVVAVEFCIVIVNLVLSSV